jgi:hypothetical protein
VLSAMGSVRVPGPAGVSALGSSRGAGATFALVWASSLLVLGAAVCDTLSQPAVVAALRALANSRLRGLVGLSACRRK